MSNLRAQLAESLDGLQSLANIQYLYRDAALSLMQSLDNLVTDASDAGQSLIAQSVERATREAIQRLLSNYPDDYGLALWMVDVLDRAREQYESGLLPDNSQTWVDFRRVWSQQFSLLKTSVTRTLEDAANRQALKNQVIELELALARTQQQSEAALEQLGETQQRYNAVLRAAENAAGGLATDQFEEHFIELRNEEARTASRFRVATIVGISVAVAFAVFWLFAPWSKFDGATPDVQRWLSFASHLAIVTGIGALTAYLGRQSGQHRRTANWAQSVAVQLQSFPALASSATEDTRDTLLTALANRVLAPPPEKGVEADATGITTAQALDVVIAALKKAP